MGREGKKWSITKVRLVTKKGTDERRACLLLGGALKDAPFSTNFFFMEGKDACLDDA